MIRPTRYYSSKQEKKVAKEVNGTTQINSGATPFYKGDVISANFLIECKTCTKEQKSFTIKKEWLETISKEAFAAHREPILAFNFGDNNNFYILSSNQFREYMRLKSEE